ncbi:ABC transporter substrate-binding protein [Desulfovibrio sp. JC010]|nr:ABC transporter substrate-binding protein [Desulfovibrio sp. JC010]NDV26627.1 ABC transporter substrate-binding protein [Desulfovibrio sp. JC010]
MLWGTAQSGLANDCGLRILTEISSPSVFEDADGSLKGFGIEIVEAMKKEIGCESPVEVMPWARGYKYVSNHPDVMLFSTARTEQREELFHWVGPIACYKWVFYGLKGGVKVKSLEEAKKVNGIGCYRKDARTQFLQGQGFSNLEITDSQDINFKKLLRGRIDLVVTSNIGIKSILEKNDELREKTVPVFTFRSVKMYLAFSKSTDSATIRRWQEAYDVLQRRGVIGDIQDRWIQRCRE